MDINSKAYWDKRFDTNWKEYDGEKQTAFFACLLCDLLPASIVKEAMSNNYSICDMGCALGDGIPIFSRKFGIEVDGMDFSSEAIEKATEKFPRNHFWVGDLQNLQTCEKTYDIAICSNVLEHFYNPWKIFDNLSSVIKKYIIIMVPYRETLNIEEHEYYFTEEVIPVKRSGFILDFVRTIDGREKEETYYPDQQILLVYKKDNNDIQMLSELVVGSVDAIKREDNKIIENKEKIIQEKEEKVQAHLQVIEQKEELLKEKDTLLKKREGDLKEKEDVFEKEKDKLQNLITEKDKETIENGKRIGELERTNTKQRNEIDISNQKIQNALDVCYKINSKTSYKLMCTFARFVKQFILGSLKEKKKFLGICKRSITRERSEFTGNDGYNMILNVANVLEFRPIDLENGKETMEEKKDIVCQQQLMTETSQCLKQEYNKTDVLIFSVIDYNFRHQRPQHFASRFAQNGHRVFYINANFINKEKTKEVSDKLFTVDLYTKECKAIYFASEWKGFLSWFKDRLDFIIQKYAIADAIIILDYPNWIAGAEYLRQNYGFKIMVDYMDDFTGFLGTTNDMLKKNCIHMLKTSDLVVASSQFLYDIAAKYAQNIEIIRNGTEVEHFYKAYGLKESNQRPVIGYYGAVSHWFAWEKVCFLAEHLPNCDIVIIGEVTDYRDKLERYKNIKLKGEMNYKDLPQHLAYFDVCLIPFDTSTDLIKATNPVKFYEYLSAGKPIVATEIPELEPFRDDYVYMSNDNNKFLEYVEICVSGKSTLKKPEECIAFARENDWQKRYENFAQACLNVVPKVSVIVLTYNNLILNKACIDSILSKTAYSNYELIILDNNSTDGTIEYLHKLDEKRYPQIKIIYNSHNSGFAGGNNKAISEASGKYIMLLNNDTVVTRGWLTNAVKHLENDAECGMCGAVTNSIGNEAMIKVNYTNLKELDEFAFGYTTTHNNQIYTDVDRLAMFCTLIRKDIMNKYGLLDENYQVGMFEDDDYAKVIEKAGYTLYIAEDVFVHHVNNASFKKLESKEYKEIFEKNKRYFEKKWDIKWEMPKYREGVFPEINNGTMVEPK